MSTPPVTAFIALGANLGDTAATLARALADLAGLPQTRCVACSSFYRSAPVDASGPDYLNAVVQLSTRLSAPALLQALHHIEDQHGRERPWRNAPRTLDLDLLLYGSLQRHDSALTLPHPRMHRRAFVLVPLAEIAPQLCIPGLGPVQQLCAAVAGQRIEKVQR